MKTATGTSLGGVAILAACACGTSSGLSKISGSYGLIFGSIPIHHIFVLAGGILVVAGLWQRARVAALLGGGAVTLLVVGEMLLPVMGINEGTRLTSTGLAGVAAYLVAGLLLVLAFRRAYQFRHSGSATLAMTGMAMSVGCNCCLVTQGVSGLAHTLAPAQTWLASTLTIYAFATFLMAIGLYRIGGWLPVATVVGGHALNYYGLELSANVAPAIMAHGIRFAHISKYPLMLLGTTIMMAAFAFAYATERQRSSGLATTPQPAMAGD